jgi:hypothetical protein
MALIQSNKKKIDELMTYFNLSFLQMHLDYENELKTGDLNPNKLKLIALDKLLKLYFINDYICLFEDNDNTFLTNDEKDFLFHEKSEELTFIKSILKDNKYFEYRYQNITILYLERKNEYYYKRLLDRII